ncbi:DNA polymerase IV [Paratractidigestivibacter sp.]|uniref:DNA polymerase IV n=1 Tax=Paratractidigestivibacter sp. TaxID=2847316 RepID=UPI002AC9AC99|nr:DNA polymerase IV [Paratractidigestivibacter sp.]
MGQHETYRDTENGALEWKGPAIGLLDLDAFFASVEQLDHLDWRGKPVIVGGSSKKRGVVSTASYEARRFGVHSAMPAFQAERLCPQAIWTQGRYERYHEMSDIVMSFLLDETPLVEQVSIDEAFFDVTPGRFSRENPIAICARVQARVAELGITCSIGVGPNKTVAKIASEQEKPRGLTAVWPGTERKFLAPLPVGAMSGIGTATQAKLEGMGIKTLGQLSRLSCTDAQRMFGVAGPRMVMRAAGLERSAVAAAAEHEVPKSVSNERTFGEDLINEDEVKAAVMHISGLVGRRLRTKGLKGRTVTLKLKYDARTGHTAQAALPSRTDQESVFGREALRLLPQIWSPGMKVRLLGVGVSGFDEAEPVQLGLFQTDQEVRDEKAERLAAATDALKARFGDDSVRYGRDLRFDGRVSDTQPMNKEKF